MKTLKKRFTGRIALVVVAILLLLSTLTACVGGANAPTLTFDETKFTMDSKEEMDKHGLAPSELKAVAELFVNAYGAGFNGIEALVAAYRGYNMLAENYDPKADYSAVKPFDKTSLSYAAGVIEKANVTAAGAKHNVFTDTELDSIVKKLNQADVETLIDAFRVKVSNQGAGLIDGILVGIGAVLNWMTTYIGFGNYVLGICLFAILIEILMLPFAIKQQKNSIKQAKLRPKEMAIKNKYKGRNDQPTMQKMQAEIQELYQRENFNPASGCLPLLIQLPIIMALYSIVMDPLHYVLGQGASISAAMNSFASASPAAGGLGMVLDSSRGSIGLLSQITAGGDTIIAQLKDFQLLSFEEGVLGSLEGALKAIPNFNIGPVNFGFSPMANDWSDWTSWILILVPVITFITYFVTSKLNRKFMYQSVANEGMDARQVACSNSMMDITMPAMSAFFTFAVPSVIGVYWAFRSWIGFGKTVIMSKAMPLPTFTEEDYKAAEREMAGKKSVKKSNKVGTVRSLHYIDDEDFEDTRERGLARRAAIEERERAEKEEKANKAIFAAVPLKDDKKKKNDEPAEEETTAESVAESENDNEKD